jgi:Superfamily II helicase and inactivated derivatives
MKEMIEIINHVKTDHKMLASYIAGGIDNGRNIMLVYLNSKSPLKIPNWFGYKATEYNAQKIKDEILAEFDSKRGPYGYGILLGKQPGGFYLVCIDIDIDNDCKDSALKQFEEIFKRHNIHYYLETTKSGRYHIYVALDKITEELKTITKLNLNCDAIKYKYAKPVEGEIELLGVNSPHMATVYNGIINNEKPFFVEQLIINSAEDFLEALKEFLGINEELNEIDYADDTDEFEETETEEIEDQNLDIGEIYKLIDFFKLVRKYNYLDGWEIEKTLSAICITQEMDGYLIHRTFEDVYGEDYDEDRTDYILDLTREKDPQRLPTIASVIYHAKEFLKTIQLTNEEKKLVEDLIKTLRRHSFGDFELPDYLLDAERVYLYDSTEKRKNKTTYYREKWFIERNIQNVKYVFYVEIETLHPRDIFKKHKKVGYSKVVSLKIDLKRLVDEQHSSVYEIIINDKIHYRPPSNYDRVEDIARAIEKKCHGLLPHFDIPLFLEYYNLKVMEYAKKHEGKPPTVVVSRTTGWNEDFTMFFHYDLNDENHELNRDHILYKTGKAKSSNEFDLERQHKLVFDLLNEGKLLGVLLVISTSSILLKPFNLQPLTCVISGTPGAGKTIAALTATSLFYKSDDILITAKSTNVGIELMLSSLNSLPFVIDEGSLADDAATVLKNLIFSVAAGKGKTRGRKDLTVDTKDIISNVFWTTETTDIDAIKRAGAFRRFLHIVVESWDQFTSLYNVRKFKPNQLYTGCGVDYIKFVVRNLDYIRNYFQSETVDFNEKYSELAGIALNIYRGIAFLELFYTQYFHLSQHLVFTKLRQKVAALLENAMKMFVSSRDDIVFQLQQYLYSNLHRFGQVDVEYVEDGQPRRKADGTPVYRVVYRPHVEALGEYDKFTQTFYITSEGIKTIARELEKERSILESALNRAGVMSKTDNAKYSQVLGRNMRFYVVKFNDLPSNTDTDTDIEF